MAPDDETSAVCLPHCVHVARAVEDEAVARAFLIRQAGVLERMSEDMKRYVLKLDGIRRGFITGEEDHARHAALTMLAGHRNVFGAIKKRDELY